MTRLAFRLRLAHTDRILPPSFLAAEDGVVLLAENNLALTME